LHASTIHQLPRRRKAEGGSVMDPAFSKAEETEEDGENGGI